MNYPKKNKFQSVPITALCLYNIQRENLVFKNSLCICGYVLFTYIFHYIRGVFRNIMGGGKYYPRGALQKCLNYERGLIIFVFFPLFSPFTVILFTFIPYFLFESLGGAALKKKLGKQNYILHDILLVALYFLLNVADVHFKGSPEKKTLSLDFNQTQR